MRETGKRQQIADGAAPGLFLIVQTTGKKSWAWRGRIAGKPRKFTLGRYPSHGLADAREWARELTRQRDGGIDPAAERSRLAAIAAAEAHRATYTVDVAFDAYMRAEGGRRKSADDKRRMYDANFKPVIGSLPLDKVDRAAIGGVIAAKFKTHPTSSNRLVALIRRFFRWCLTKGHDETGLTVDPAAHITKLADEVKRDRVLTDYEVALLLTALRDEEPAFAIPMRLLLLTGARRSEMFEARWDEFDMAAGNWLLPANRSKNNLPHIVPLSADAQAIINAIPPCASSPLLFGSARNPANAVSGISKMMARLRARMERLAADRGRTVAHWQIHDLRRTAATGMAALKVPPHEVEAVLNHVSGARASVAGIYNRHAYFDEKQRALEVWAAKVSHIEKHIAV